MAMAFFRGGEPTADDACTSFLSVNFTACIPDVLLVTVTGGAADGAPMVFAGRFWRREAVFTVFLLSSTSAASEPAKTGDSDATTNSSVGFLMIALPVSDF